MSCMCGSHRRGMGSTRCHDSLTNSASPPAATSARSSSYSSRPLIWYSRGFTGLLDSRPARLLADFLDVEVKGHSCGQLSRAEIHFQLLITDGGPCFVHAPDNAVVPVVALPNLGF